MTAAADPPRPNAPSGAPARRAPGLLALGSAAVLAVYAAGLVRTEEAARLAAASSSPRRRPAPDTAGFPSSPAADRSLAVPHAPDAAPPTPVVSANDAVSLPVRPAATAPASRDTTRPVDAATGAASVPTAPAANASPAAAATAMSLSPSNTAPATVPPPVPVVASDAPPVKPVVDSTAKAPVGWRDGTWSGWGTSRHGDIEATVLIEKGRITGAAISQCLTRYSCSWIAHLQAQVVARQSPEVDNVSGATESANAFYYAVVDALKHAK